MSHRKNHQSDYCTAAHKRRFRDAREAPRSLRNLRRQAALLDAKGIAHRIRVVRKYECPSCKGWHLTSWQDYSPPTTTVTALKTPRGQDRTWNAVEVRYWVDTYLASDDARGSLIDYMRWARITPGAPAAAATLEILGMWPEATPAAA